MKKLCIICFAFFVVTSCNNSTNANETHSNADSTGISNPISIDTIKHPTGVDNSSVISTDTAAMNTGNAIKKGDSAAHSKSK